MTKFAYGRSTLPPVTLSTSSGDIQGGGSTYYFWLQGRNRAGCNLPSDVASIAVPNGSSINITIPASARRNGEDWHSYVISASLTDSFSTSVVVAEFPGYEEDQNTPTTLGSSPTLTLSKPEHIKLTSLTVGNPSLLPTGSNLINGMRRSVTSTGLIYAYRQGSTKLVDNVYILNSGLGRWEYIDRLNESVSTIFDGCAKDIISTNRSDLIESKYDLSGSLGTPVRYYLPNYTGANLPTGTRIIINTSIAGSPLPANSLSVSIEGYVDLSTGILDTTDMININTANNYDPNTRNLMLEKPLPNNYALVLRIYPSFNLADLGTLVVPQGAEIVIYPQFTQSKGVYVDSNVITGDQILPELDLMRVVPYGPNLGLAALSGSGIVRGYGFRNILQQEIGGTQDNTADQIVTITTNGYCTVGTVSPTTQQRAVISSVHGTTIPCAYSAIVSVAADRNLNVTCNFPVDVDGFATIRSNYSDGLIAGLIGKAKLNTTKIAIYVTNNSSGAIKVFYKTIIPTEQSAILTIDDWSLGTTVGSLPSADIGLFAPTGCSFSTTAGSSGIPAADYKVAYSFVYDNDSPGITEISHSVIDGCMITTTSPLNTVQESQKYFIKPVNDLTELRNIGSLSRYPGSICNVKALNKLYLFDANSTVADDGATVIKPSDLSAPTPGRWVENTLTDAGGSGDLTYGDTTLLTLDDLRSVPVEDLVHGRLFLCNVKHFLYNVFQPQWYCWQTFANATEELGELILKHNTENGFFVRVSNKEHYDYGPPPSTIPFVDGGLIMNRIAPFTWVDTSESPYKFYDYTFTTPNQNGTWVQRGSGGSGGGITTVQDLTELRAIDTSTITVGTLVEVVQPYGSSSDLAAIYAYKDYPDIGEDAGTLLIMPNSGTGYWYNINRIEIWNTEPGSLGGINMYVKWIEKKTSPSRTVVWEMDPFTGSWIKSGPTVLTNTSSAPSYSPGDFEGQQAQDNTGRLYVYSNGGGGWTQVGGKLNPVSSISNLKTLSVSGLAEGTLVTVLAPEDDTFPGYYSNKPGVYAYIPGMIITADVGKVLIKPNSGGGVWCALDRTEISTAEPPYELNYSYRYFQGHIRWIQKKSSPTRYVFWEYMFAANSNGTWIKSGPPVQNSGVPSFFGDFEGQICQNSDIGGASYIWKYDSWVQIS